MIVMFSCLSLLAAIGWQGIYGHRNVEFRRKLTEQSVAAQAALATVSAQRVALETRVALLRPGTIDADLVDEIARRDLNMGGKRDMIAHIPN